MSISIPFVFRSFSNTLPGLGEGEHHLNGEIIAVNGGNVLVCTVISDNDVFFILASTGVYVLYTESWYSEHTFNGYFFAGRDESIDYFTRSGGDKLHPVKEYPDELIGAM